MTMWEFLVLHLVIFVINQTHGVQLSLDLEVKTMSGGQTTCGILQCAEDARSTSVSTISSLTVYKQMTGSGQRRRLTVANLSQQQPSVSRFWNGIKMNGTWTPQKAEATLYLVEIDDCHLAEFSCQVTFKDGLGQERRSLSLVGRPGSEPVQSAVLTDRSHVTFGEVLSTNAILSNREGSSMAAALQLSAIIQQTQTSLAGRVQHLQERMEDKMDALEKGLGDLESGVRSPLRCNECNADRGNHIKGSNNETNEYLELLKQSMESLKKYVSSTTQENVSTMNALSSSLSQLGGRVDELFEQSNSSSKNVLDSIQGAITRTETSLTELIESPDETQKESTCLRDNDGPSISAYHVVHPTGDRPPYLCNADGGWTVIQRRSTGVVDFYRDWASYKKGFGSFDDDFWLGNDNIYKLTSSKPHELIVKLMYGGKTKYAHYDSFSIGSEGDNYKLRIGSYKGTAGDSLIYHNDCYFSTFDRENDSHATLNCAKTFTGAWWYGSCHNVNLNGQWGEVANKGPRWSWFSSQNPVTFSEMAIRAKVV